MIEKVALASMFTFAAWYTMQKGEIFSFLGDLFNNLPPKLHNPVFECPVCMGFWYGSLFYWVVYHNNIKEWLIVAVCTVGFNCIISKIERPEINS